MYVLYITTIKSIISLQINLKQANLDLSVSYLNKNILPELRIYWSE